MGRGEKDEWSREAFGYLLMEIMWLDGHLASVYIFGFVTSQLTFTRLGNHRYRDAILLVAD